MKRLFLLFTLITCLASAGPSTAAETGINSQDLGATETIDRAEAAKAVWVRRFIGWNEMQLERGGPINSGILAYLDQLTAQAQLRGKKVMFAFNGAPSWANGSSDPLVPPTNADEFAQFVQFIANRYKGKVQAYEMWNEPDASEFWHGSSPSPEAYTPLLKAGYTAVKAVDPAAIVLAGPLTGNNYRFVEGLYRVGAKGYFDGVSTHTDTACNLKSPYDYYRDPDGRIGQYTFMGFREVHQVMSDNGDGDKIMMMTELGWSTTTEICNRTARAGTKAGGVSEADQNLFLRQAYNCLDQYPYMRAGIWFNLRDTTSANTELSRYGLLHHDFAPKPSYSSMIEVGEKGNVLREPCGDFTPPEVTIYQPRQGEIFNGILNFTVSAKDDQSDIARIRVLADNKRLRSVVKPKNGEKASFYWWRAQDAPLGPITLTIEARDVWGNISFKQVNVNKVDVNKLPAQTTKLSLKASARGSRGRVQGYAYVAGTQLTPTGKILLSWQKKSGSRYRTVYKQYKFTTRPFKLSRKLAKGTWRIKASYAKDSPFSAASKNSSSFRVR